MSIDKSNNFSPERNNTPEKFPDIVNILEDIHEIGMFDDDIFHSWKDKIFSILEKHPD